MQHRLPMWLIVLAMMTLSLGAVTSVRGQLDLGRDYDRPIPSFYVEQRIGELEQQMDRLRRDERTRNNERAQLVNNASIQVRTIARVLLQLGDGSAETSGAVLAGTTLANHATTFDRFFAQYLTMPDGAAAQRFGDALRRFTDVERATVRPDGSSPAQVRSYLVRSMSSLLSALPAVEAAKLVGSWPPAADAEATQPGFMTPTPIAEDMAVLSRRVAELQGAAEAREHIGRVLQMLGRAADLPELAPQTADSYRQMQRIVDYIASLDAVQWLGDSERQVIENDLRDAMAAYLNPRQRHEAQVMLDQLFAFEALLASMAQLKHDDAAVASLRDLFAAALGRLRGEGEERLIGAATLQWITRAASIIARQRSLSIEGLEPDLRTAFARFTHHYMQSEQLVGQVAQQLAGDSRMIAMPVTSVSLWYLEQRCEDLAVLTRLKGYSNRVAGIAAASRTPVAQHISELAAQLVDPTLGRDASRAIARFDRQVTAFTQLPGEATWRDAIARGQTPEVAYVGKHLPELLDRINAQRREWVTAWAQGDSGSQAAHRLEDLALLTALLERAATIERLCVENGTFNRWGALEVEAVGVRRLAAELREQMKLGVEAALLADWAALEAAMQLVRGQHVTAVVLVECHRLLADHLQTLPTDVGAAMSQLLLDPWPDGLLHARRDELATISRCLNEQTHPGLTVGSASWEEAQKQMHAAALRVAVDLPEIHALLVVEPRPRAVRESDGNRSRGSDMMRQ